MNTLVTKRLLLSRLHESEHAFIVELLNTEGWLKFIGERNIRSTADAIAYINKINGNPFTNYYTVKEIDTQVPVGLVTLIQRDYLQQQDIGFAFLPTYCGKGYAYEAAKAVLDHIWCDDSVTQIHAVTLPHNSSSIKLVEKLGLAFTKEIEVNNEMLQLFTIDRD